MKKRKCLQNYRIWLDWINFSNVENVLYFIYSQLVNDIFSAYAFININ